MRLRARDHLRQVQRADRRDHAVLDLRIAEHGVLGGEPQVAMQREASCPCRCSSRCSAAITGLSSGMPTPGIARISVSVVTMRPVRLISLMSEPAQNALLARAS